MRGIGTMAELVSSKINSHVGDDWDDMSQYEYILTLAGELTVMCPLTRLLATESFTRRRSRDFKIFVRARPDKSIYTYVDASSSNRVYYGSEAGQHGGVPITGSMKLQDTHQFMSVIVPLIAGIMERLNYGIPTCYQHKWFMLAILCIDGQVHIAANIPRRSESPKLDIRDEAPRIPELSTYWNSVFNRREEIKESMKFGIMDQWYQGMMWSSQLTQKYYL